MLRQLFKTIFRPSNLWSAARLGDVEAIERLVSEGAGVNERRETLNTPNWTPLHYAAYYKRNEAMRELVKLGGKINVRDGEGDTPLILAIKNGADTALIDLMIQLGADVNKGVTSPLVTAIGEGNEEIVWQLLSRGANPKESANNKSVTGPLWLAAALGYPSVVRMLLKSGAEVNSHPENENALDSAAMRGYLDIVCILLTAGADPNHRDSQGGTPIMFAVFSKRTEVVETLLKAGADVNAKSYDGRTALDRAEREKSAKIINFLKQAGAKRGNELPKIEQPEQSNTFWELENGMVLSAAVEPWPAKARSGNLKIEICRDDYRQSFSGTLEYRSICSEKDPRSWNRVFGETDEDGDFSTTEEIVLANGENFLQFRIKGKDDKDFTEIQRWLVKVK